MSILGDKLNQYIEESGYSVNKLATLSGVNRTSIVRMINANRHPEQHNIEKLIPYLKLTNDQKEGLWKTYEIASSGESLYTRRQYMLKLMRQVYKPGLFPLPDTGNDVVEGAPLLNPADSHENKIVHGRYEIAHNMVLSFFSQSSYEISVFAPFTSDFISDFFKHFTKKRPAGLHIRHMTHFIKNPSKDNDINYNLSILAHVLPLAFTDSIDYDVYFSYVTAPLTSQTQLMYPYFMIIGKCLVLLSFDFENAIFINSVNMVDEYQKHFDEIITASEKLVHSTTSVRQLSEYFPPTNIKRSGFCKFGSQPWLFTLMDFDEVMASIKVADELREAIISSSKHHADSGKKLDCHISFFSKHGLELFARDSAIMNFPKDFTPKFSRTARIRALERLKGYMIRAINELAFPMNPHISIQVTQENRLAISYIDNTDSRFKVFYMNEPTLMDAFIDFLEYSATSPFLCSDIVYSEDETVQIIDDCIEMIRNK